MACNVIRDKQELLDLPQHKLTQDVINRWNSSYEMLDHFLEQQAAIMATLMSKDLGKGATDVNTLSESDITNVENIN